MPASLCRSRLPSPEQSQELTDLRCTRQPTEQPDTRQSQELVRGSPTELLRQNSPTVSALFRLPRARYVPMSMFSEMNRTEPSIRAKVQPPTCKLRNEKWGLLKMQLRMSDS